MADPEIQQILHVTWQAWQGATNVSQGVHLPYEWIVVLNSCNLFRFAGLHTIGVFWSRLAIQQLEDPQINMFLKEMQNNPREAQKQMMSDRAAGLFWCLAVGCLGEVAGYLGGGYLKST